MSVATDHAEEHAERAGNTAAGSQRLHLIGAWYIWISFAVAVGKRVPLDRFD